MRKVNAKSWSASESFWREGRLLGESRPSSAHAATSRRSLDLSRLHSPCSPHALLSGKTREGKEQLPLRAVSALAQRSTVVFPPGKGEAATRLSLDSLEVHQQASFSELIFDALRNGSGVFLLARTTTTATDRRPFHHYYDAHQLHSSLERTNRDPLSNQPVDEVNYHVFLGKPEHPVIVELGTYRDWRDRKNSSSILVANFLACAEAQDTGRLVYGIALLGARGLLTLNTTKALIESSLRRAPERAGVVGARALSLAAGGPSSGEVGAIVADFADLHHRFEGYTPLHIAARCGDHALVEQLRTLPHADPRAKTSDARLTSALTCTELAVAGALEALSRLPSSAPRSERLACMRPYTRVIHALNAPQSASSLRNQLEETVRKLEPNQRDLASLFAFLQLSKVAAVQSPWRS